MSKEDLKEKTETEDVKQGKGKFDAFLNWIWDPKTKQFLGRTGSSWAKVGVFYLIFYTCLAIFWALMLKVFMTTINYEAPKWQLEESLIGLSPGLAFRPSPRVIKVDSTLIQYVNGQNASYHKWVKDLNNYLQPYRDQYNKRGDCSKTFPNRSPGCPFLIDVNNNRCGANFGYDTGSPCILIKLNRVINWRPNPFKNPKEMSETLNKNPKSVKFTPKTDDLTDLSNGEGIVSLHCDGENAVDRKHLGPIEYWPKQGFPAEYFPYTKQPDYLSPFVLVKFNNPARNQVINVECVALDKNITVNRYDREGTVSFQLKIE